VGGGGTPKLKTSNVHRVTSEPVTVLDEAVTVVDGPRGFSAGSEVLSVGPGEPSWTLGGQLQ